MRPQSALGPLLLVGSLAFSPSCEEPTPPAQVPDLRGGQPDGGSSIPEPPFAIIRKPEQGAENLFGIYGVEGDPIKDRFYLAGSRGTILLAEPEPKAEPDQPPPTLADGRAKLRYTRMAVPQEVQSDLTAIHGTANNDIYAVGLGGVILRYDGTTWTKEVPKKAKPEDPAFTADLWGVFAYMGGAVAVGEGGYVVKRVMGAWGVPQKLPVPSLSRVYGTAGNNLYAVGAVGYIFRHDGTNWGTVSPAGFTTKLAGIFGSAANNLYAVGLTGSVLKSTGGGFSDYGGKISPLCGVGTLPKTFLRGGLVTASSQVLIIGWEGTIARLFEGRCGDAGMALSVYNESGVTTHRLEGIWGYKEGAQTVVYISGAEGILLRGVR